MNAIVKVGDQAQALIGEIASDLQSSLPANMPLDRFRSTFVAAVSHNPELMAADPQSLKTALLKCALDHLMPDNREATIQIYNTKENRGGQDVWLKKAQYMPMVQGIRKRAKELGGIAEIVSECVYANDLFECVMGDEPYIKHVPTPFGKQRGEIVGAYAIFKDDKGKIIHREPMPKEEIEKSRAASKSKEGPAWKNFYSEMARKTVVRRGSKSIPSMPEELRTIIERDDEYVDLQGTSSLPASNRNPLIEDHSNSDGGTAAQSTPQGNQAVEGNRNPGGSNEVGTRSSNQTEENQAAGPSHAGQDGGKPSTESNSSLSSSEHAQTKRDDDGSASAVGDKPQPASGATSYDYAAFSRALARATQHKSLATYKEQFCSGAGWTADEACKPTLLAIYSLHQKRLNNAIPDAEFVKKIKELGAA